MPSITTIYIFECDHRLQRICPAFDDVALQQHHQDQQRAFASVLTDFLKAGVTFVGEEIGEKQASIAQALARGFGCTYSRIDMPLAERIRRGCPPDYEVLFKIDGLDAAVLNCHRLREEYMRKRILEYLDGSHGLVLCGRTHAHRLRADLAN